MTLSTVLLLATLIATPQLPAPSGFVPIAPGVRWTYRVSNEREPREVSIGAPAMIATFDAEQLHAFELKGFDRRSPAFIAPRAGGRVQLFVKEYNGAFATDEHRIFTLLDLRFEGDETWKINAPHRGMCHIDTLAISRVAKEERVTVPAGEYSCTRIEHERSHDRGDHVTLWIARGVGIVRAVFRSYDGESTWELISAEGAKR